MNSVSFSLSVFSLEAYNPNVLTSFCWFYFYGLISVLQTNSGSSRYPLTEAGFFFFPPLSPLPCLGNKACKSTAKYASFHFLISGFDRPLILLLFWPLLERETNHNGNKKLMLYSDPMPKQPHNHFSLTCMHHLYLWDQSQGHSRNILVNHV